MTPIRLPERSRRSRRRLGVAMISLLILVAAVACDRRQGRDNLISEWRFPAPDGRHDVLLSDHHGNYVFVSERWCLTLMAKGEDIEEGSEQFLFIGSFLEPDRACSFEGERKLVVRIDSAPPENAPDALGPFELEFIRNEND